MVNKRAMKEERYILFDYFEPDDNEHDRTPFVLDFTTGQMENFKKKWAENVPIGKIAASLGISKNNAKLIFIDLEINGEIEERPDGWEGFLNNKYKLFSQPEHMYLKTEFTKHQVVKFVKLWNEGVPLKVIAKKIDCNYDSALLLWQDLYVAGEIDDRPGGQDGGQGSLF